MQSDPEDFGGDKIDMYVIAGVALISATFLYVSTVMIRWNWGEREGKRSFLVRYIFHVFMKPRFFFGVHSKWLIVIGLKVVVNT